jgi:hypothetical protein
MPVYSSAGEKSSTRTVNQTRACVTKAGRPGFACLAQSRQMCFHYKMFRCVAFDFYFFYPQKMAVETKSRT